MIYVCILNYLQFLQSVAHCHILPKMDEVKFIHECPICHFVPGNQCKPSVNKQHQHTLSVNAAFTRNTLCSTEEKELCAASLAHRISYIILCKRCAQSWLCRLNNFCIFSDWLCH